jgi:hypothetical protein
MSFESIKLHFPHCQLAGCRIHLNYNNRVTYDIQGKITHFNRGIGNNLAVYCEEMV